MDTAIQFLGVPVDTVTGTNPLIDTKSLDFVLSVCQALSCNEFDCKIKMAVCTFSPDTVYPALHYINRL